MRPVVITVGRLNPPTRGHEVLFTQVLDVAFRLNATPIVYIVDGVKSGKDLDKNPLSGQERIAWLRRLYPEIKFDVAYDAFNVMELLEVQGLEPMVWVAGSDRAPNYRKLVDHQGLQCLVVEVDREAGEADGVSATAARQAAREGDFQTFKSLMPKRADDEDLRTIMKMIQERQDVTAAGTVSVQQRSPELLRGAVLP